MNKDNSSKFTICKNILINILKVCHFFDISLSLISARTGLLRLRFVCAFHFKQSFKISQYFRNLSLASPPGLPQLTLWPIWPSIWASNTSFALANFPLLIRLFTPFCLPSSAQWAIQRPATLCAVLCCRMSMKSHSKMCSPFGTHFLSSVITCTNGRG